MVSGNSPLPIPRSSSGNPRSGNSTHWSIKVVGSLPTHRCLIVLDVEGTVTSPVRGPRGALKVRPGTEDLINMLVYLGHEVALWSETQPDASLLEAFSRHGILCYRRMDALTEEDVMTPLAAINILGRLPDVIVDDNPLNRIDGVSMILVSSFS